MYNLQEVFQLLVMEDRIVISSIYAVRQMQSYSLCYDVISGRISVFHHRKRALCVSGTIVFQVEWVGQNQS